MSDLRRLEILVIVGVTIMVLILAAAVYSSVTTPHGGASAMGKYAPPLNPTQLATMATQTAAQRATPTVTVEQP